MANGKCYITIKGLLVYKPKWGAIQLGAANPTTNIHHITVDNCYVDTPANNHGVWFGFAEAGCHDVTVKNCTIKNTKSESIYMGHYNYMSDTITGIIIDSNTIVDSGLTGEGDIDIKPGCFGAIVRNNTHYQTLPPTRPTNYGNCGVVIQANNCQVYNNTFYNAVKKTTGDPGWGKGIYASGDGDAQGNGKNITSLLIYNNLIYKCQGEGISFTANDGSVTGVKIWNNTIVGNAGGISAKAYSGKSISIELKNNLIANNTAGIYCDGNVTFSISNYNCIYGGAGSLLRYGGSYRTWSYWQNTLHFDGNGKNVDPSLNSAYRPDSSGDPVVNAGTSLSAYFTIDRIGTSRPQGASWDMGAYEYIGTGPTYYTISGTIKDAGSVGMAGVTVTLSGSGSGNQTTPANGTYSFTGLATGNYTVIPTKTGYTFNPTNRTFTGLNANQTAQDFVGTPLVDVQFSDDFESWEGAIGQWTEKRCWGSINSISASTIFPMLGNCSLRAYDNDAANSEVMLRKSITDRPNIYTRFYVYLSQSFWDAIPVSGLTRLFYITPGATSGNHVELAASKDASGNQRFYLKEGIGWTTKYANGAVGGKWYCFEIHVPTCAANGTMQWWIDGVEQTAFTGVNFSKTGQWRDIRLGIYGGAAAYIQTAYFDNIVVADSYIGLLDEQGRGVQDVVNFKKEVFANFSSVKIFPNPFIINKRSGGGASGSAMRFTRTPIDTELSIYTTSGKFVCKLRSADYVDGEIRWDGKNDNGEYIAQGVYLYVLKTSDGQKKTGKIAVKRVE